MKKKYHIYFTAFLSMLFWGISFVLIKPVFDYYRPFSIIFMRLLLASIFLLGYQGITKSWQPLRIKELPLFILLAFFEPFCYFMGESFGLQYVSATVGSIVIAMIPLIAPFFSYFILKEKITLFVVLGLILSFVGIGMTVFSDEVNYSLKGLALIFFAVLSGVGYGIVARKLTLGFSSLQIVTLQNVFGFLLFLPFFLAFDSRNFIQVYPSFKIIISVLLLAIFPSTFAYILFTKVIRELGITNANIFTNLIPIFTSVFSFLLLKETFSIQKIIGVFVVIAGLFVSQIPVLILNQSNKKKCD